MTENRISPDRWQGMYGHVPQDFDLLVQRTLKKTREAPVMKRFTLRTALVMLICLLLLTGIALAATGVFSTKNSLNMYTSAPTDGAGVDIQTDLNQTGGDFPDLTVTVRDAVFDGVTAYVTVEYRLKNPEKDMILSHWDTEGFKKHDVGRWPGYSMVPLTDPEKDPRRKLVIHDDGALVYGVYNNSITDHIYESDGVLVLTWRVRMDSDSEFAVEYSPENGLVIHEGEALPLLPTYPPGENIVVPSVSIDTEPISIPGKSVTHESVNDVLQKIASPEPLELILSVELQEWTNGANGYRKKLYNCDAGITLNKSSAPVVRSLPAPIDQGEMTLADATFTFTKLATYADIQTQFTLGFGTRPGDGDLGTGLAFEMLDQQGNIIRRLGVSSCGTYSMVTIDDRHLELNRYTAFWPAMEEVPDTITLRAYSYYTDEYLATFTVPLVLIQDISPTLSP